VEVLPAEQITTETLQVRGGNELSEEESGLLDSFE